MGRNLRFWLGAPRTAPFDPGDTPLALGALLLRAQRSDFPEIIGGIVPLEAVLARRYDLTTAEAAEMREACERVEAAAPPGPWFAELLHEVIDPAQRQAMALSLLEAVEAQTPQPDLLRPHVDLMAQTVLGVCPEDLASARQAG
ncbi:hypothetical protein GCM10011415_05970 [Salipiger pallidus]|uniref:Tellurite resistance protein TerB n=1 Tax=Salipiger pallidus TaxID=1775170 RepID=A0A8J2ZH16_9RHOB|nr:hypothetical protein [Salipiger pallidus]GGG62479.1 hypothetical protein GCM10011415_05970 [Salipiger pallidus]